MEACGSGQGAPALSLSPTTSASASLSGASSSRGRPSPRSAPAKGPSPDQLGEADEPPLPSLRRTLVCRDAASFERWRGSAPVRHLLPDLASPSARGGPGRVAEDPGCGSLAGAPAPPPPVGPAPRVPVASPLSRPYRAWSTLVYLVDCSYTAFLVPVLIGMGVGASDGWARAVNLAAGAVFAVDMVASFNVGFVVTWGFRRALVMERARIARYYVLSSPRFLTDAVMVLPWALTIVVHAAGGEEEAESVAGAVSWLRLFRLVRLAAILHEMVQRVTGAAPQLAVRVGRAGGPALSPEAVFFALLWYLLAVTINFLGMFLHATAVWQGLQHPAYYRDGAVTCHPGDNWVCALGEEASTLPAQWLTSLYWALTTVTTVGFGDIVPGESPRATRPVNGHPPWHSPRPRAIPPPPPAATLLERGMMICVETAGILFFAFTFGAISTHLSQGARETGHRERRWSRVRDAVRWTQRRGLPPPLASAVYSYYSEVWGREEARWVGTDAEESIFVDLPPSLRAQAAAFLAGGLVAQVTGFKHLSVAHRDALSSRLRLRTAPPGIDVCTEGAEAASLFLLTEGAVAVVHRDRAVGVVRAPAALCERAALVGGVLGSPRVNPRGFRAVEVSSLWELPSADLRQLAARSPSFALRLARGVAELVRAKVDRSPGAYADDARALEAALEELRRLGRRGRGCGLAPERSRGNAGGGEEDAVGGGGSSPIEFQDSKGGGGCEEDEDSCFAALWGESAGEGSGAAGGG